MRLIAGVAVLGHHSGQAQEPAEGRVVIVWGPHGAEAQALPGYRHEHHAGIYDSRLRATYESCPKAQPNHAHQHLTADAEERNARSGAPVARESANYKVMQFWSGCHLADNEWLRGRFIKFDNASTREAMLGLDGRKERLAPHVLNIAASDGRRTADERDVEPTINHRCYVFARRTFNNVDRHTRVLRHPFADQAMQKAGRDRRDSSDVQQAFACSTRHVGRADCCIKIEEHDPYVRQEANTSVGQPYTRPVPLEQRYTEAVLKVTYPPAEDGLPHTQMCRSSPKSARLGDSDKALKIPQFQLDSQSEGGR